MAPCRFYHTETDGRRTGLHNNGEGSGIVSLCDKKMATHFGRRNIPGGDRAFSVKMANEPPSPPISTRKMDCGSPEHGF
jgi:hypothetical protein